MTFNDLNLIAPIQQALTAEGYTIPTPIQQQAIPLLLNGQDLLGCAQTGTGKTAAFAIPILQHLSAMPAPARGQNRIKALILTPTRELAIQIEESFKAYGKNLPLKHLVIFGGVGQKPQTDALHRGVDILVATPGRLLDLMNQGFINLNHITHFVLDEADRMLDMGFVHDVKRVIAKLPAKRQSLFFSATMAPDIIKLSDTMLTNPARVEVTPISSTADTIVQSVYFVEKNNKKDLLIHVLQDKSIKTALVFTRTKHGADRVVKDLVKAGIQAEAIHGNKSQNARQRALANFKAQTTRILVATDIAARGIDVEELGHVINYELPNISETYVHRIGRTGRAGNSGISISFCDAEEKDYFRDIVKLIGRSIPAVENQPYHMAGGGSGPAAKMPPRQQRPPRAQNGSSRPNSSTSRPSARPQHSNSHHQGSTDRPVRSTSGSGSNGNSGNGGNRRWNNNRRPNQD